MKKILLLRDIIFGAALWFFLLLIGLAGLILFVFDLLIKFAEKGSYSAKGKNA